MGLPDRSGVAGYQTGRRPAADCCQQVAPHALGRVAQEWRSVLSLGALLAGSGQRDRGRSRRRAYPIHFYSGRNGSGKSHAAVYDTLPDLDAGTPVLSTVRLLDFRNPRPCEDSLCLCDKTNEERHAASHPCFVPFTTWVQLLEFRTGVILMDEITGVADSNEGASLPGAVANHLAQLRRGDLAVRMTGLNFIRANKRIREACNAVSVCKGFLPVTVQDDDGKDKLWRQRRLSLVKTYDAQSLPIDDISQTAYEKADRVGSGRFWIPTSLALKAYDSMDFVLTVGSVTDSGRCAHCAGTRRAQECSCEDYQVEKQRRKDSALQTRSGEAPNLRLTSAGGAFRGGLADVAAQ